MTAMDVRAQIDVNARMYVPSGTLRDEEVLDRVIDALQTPTSTVISGQSDRVTVDDETGTDIFSVSIVLSDAGEGAATEAEIAQRATGHRELEILEVAVTASPLPYSEEQRLRALLRDIRTRERESIGVSHPDPRTGVPMIGTGHCHFTCMEAETEELVMAGGFFRHPDGYDYEHSWLIHRASGVLIDPTADQWHREEFEDVAFLPAGDPRRTRYVTGQPILSDEGYWEECAYEPPEEYTIRVPPEDPTRRGRTRVER